MWVTRGDLVQVAKAFHPSEDAGRRPTVVGVDPRLEKAEQLKHARGRTDDLVLYDYPTALDPNLLYGHPSVARHTNRWHAAAYFYPGGGRTPLTLYKEQRGRFIYYVMSASRSSDNLT
jgi:hypothetical protein